MQSPFKIFRKHQKVVLAGLTLMAMLAFGVGDTMMRWVRVGGPTQANANVVETNIGGLSPIAMNNLLVNRRNLHRFIAMAFQRAHPEYNKKEFAMIMPMILDNVVKSYGFGGLSKPELLFSWLHRHEARKLGVVVSDGQIEDYIDRFTDRKLSSRKFREILDDMHLSSKELFDALRDELQAEIAFRMKSPARLPSPEKYWEYYQQLNTRQKIEAAALPIRDFAGQVPEPAAAQVVALFQKHKEDYERAGNGEFRPGFRQPRRVKLHYLTLNPTAVEDRVQALGPVTEKEIEDYYEKNKDTVLWLQERSTPPLDENEPLLPEFAPEKEAAKEAAKEPGDDAGAKDDSDESQGKPEGKAEQPDGDDTRPPADRPRSKDNGARRPAEHETDCLPGAATDDDEDEKPASDAGSDPAAERAADDGEDEDKSKEKKPPVGKSDAAESVDGKVEKEEPDAKEEIGAGDKPGDKDPKGTGKKKPEAPKIRYKPLDENLGEQIRDSIVNERRRNLLKEQTAKAVKALQEVGLKFATSPDIKLTDPNAAQLKEIERRSEAELKDIAESLGMKFSKTDLVSDVELREIPGLGRAVEPLSMETPRSELTSIVDQTFGNEALCRWFQSENLLDDTIYVGWKVQDVAAHIPRLEDAGVREQVVRAWKRQESLPLAKKRAEELAHKARDSEKDLAKLLGGETVTGEKKGLAVTVSTSPEFSIWQDSSAPRSMRQGSQAQVRLGNPIVVTSAGLKFMQSVFQLSVGDVDAIVNDDVSVYYVVKMVSRHDADREAFKDAALFKTDSPYAEVARIERQMVVSQYARRLEEKYAVKWTDVGGRETGPVEYDE